MNRLIFRFVCLCSVVGLLASGCLKKKESAQANAAPAGQQPAAPVEATPVQVAPDAPEIAVGDSKEEVAKIIGSPKGKMATGGTETWMYERGEVNFRNGLVESHDLKPLAQHQQEIREQKEKELQVQAGAKQKEEAKPGEQKAEKKSEGGFSAWLGGLFKSSPKGSKDPGAKPAGEVKTLTDLADRFTSDDSYRWKMITIGRQQGTGGWQGIVRLEAPQGHTIKGRLTDWFDRDCNARVADGHVEIQILGYKEVGVLTNVKLFKIIDSFTLQSTDPDMFPGVMRGQMDTK